MALVSETLVKRDSATPQPKVRARLTSVSTLYSDWFLFPGTDTAQENNPRILEPRASSLCGLPRVRRVAGGPSSLSVTLAAFPVVARQPKTTQLKTKKHTRKCVDLIPSCKRLCPLRRAPAGGHLCREVHVPPVASLPGRVARRPYKTIGAQIHNKVNKASHDATWQRPLAG